MRRTFAVAAIFLLSSCSARQDLNVALQGVSQFHASLNSERYDSIWTNSTTEYQKTTTADQHRKLMAAVHRKLGDAGPWSTTGFFVNYSPTGPIIRLQGKTQFTRGEADESFIWRINSGKPELMQYNVNSNAFLLSD